MPQPVPDHPAIHDVRLGVADLERSVRFYTKALGLDLLEQGAGEAVLGVDGRGRLVLEAHPGAVRDPAAAGLFHVAWLVPDRAALGRVLRRLLDRGMRLTGAADHAVSEAVYLDDPDGHGIEVYRDRPRSEWEGRVERVLTNRPLNEAGILEAADGMSGGLPAGSTIGHLHLETHDLKASDRFYTGTLGMTPMVRWPQAHFLAWNGYHHHMGLNTWRGRTRPLDPARDRIALRGIGFVGKPPGEGIEDPVGVPLSFVPA